MVRTVISLDEADKRWLDRQAALLRVSRAEVVRQAIQALRATRKINDENFSSLLDDTAGIWPQGNGLAWQQDHRVEWLR